MSIYKIVLSSFSNRGLISTINLMLGEVYYNFKYGFIFDYGAETNELKRSDYYAYQGTSWVILNKIFKFLSADEDFNLSKTVLLDYGCGKGRVMIVALEFGVLHVFGVEYDKRIFNDCCNNLNKVFNFKKNKRKTNYECTHEDAKDYVIPKSCNTVFIYNPFGRKVMNQIITNLKDFVYKEETNITVIYVNPVFGEILIENGFTEIGNIANDVLFYKYKYER
jgi:SAM-dependent methyltransferase